MDESLSSAPDIAKPEVLGFCFFEHRGLEPVPLQQLVELGAIALGELRRLGDVAAGDLEQPHQIVPLE